jgi:hypothetical protein
MKIRELNMQTGTHIDIVITLGNLMESQGMDPAVLGQDISTPAAVVSQQQAEHIANQWNQQFLNFKYWVEN